MTTTQDLQRQPQTALVDPIIDEGSGEISCPVCGQLCFETATPTVDVGDQEESILARICRRHRSRSIILPVPADVVDDATPVEIEIDGEPFAAVSPDHE